MDKMDKATKRLLKQNPELEFLKDKGIVKCKLSGHEMPCKVDIIESFVKGKKFKRLKDNQQTEKLPEHLSLSAIHKGKIFCALTNCYINCSAGNIERHTTGRRYQRALQQFQQGNLELHKEQQMENEEVEDDTTDQQTAGADSIVDKIDEDEINDDDDEIDNQDGITDDHDDELDQHQELKELIQTAASISKHRRKRKNLTVKNTSKEKSKKARIS